MNLSCDFSVIETLMIKMGANIVSWKAAMNPLDGLEEIDIILRGPGLELSSLDDLEVDGRGLLSIQGRPVILYIKDSRKPKDVLLNSPEESVRFHVAECNTLERMKREKRFERYVLTNNTSGIFKVDFDDWETGEMGTVEAKLHVCKNCLRRLNYKNYKRVNKKQQKEIWLPFDIEEFFKEFHPRFTQLPSRTENMDGRSDYPENWNEITNRIRSLHNWVCAQCGVDLSLPEDRKYLQTHHINGVRSDNSTSNLKPLCLLCHKSQPQHQHLRISPSGNLLILKKRLEQGIRYAR